MAISKHWNMNDNIYVLNRRIVKVLPSTEGIDPMLVDYCKNHTRNECFNFNNRDFFMYINPSEEIKKQYNKNRDYIITLFNTSQRS